MTEAMTFNQLEVYVSDILGSAWRRKLAKLMGLHYNTLKLWKDRGEVPKSRVEHIKLLIAVLKMDEKRNASRRPDQDDLAA